MRKEVEAVVLPEALLVVLPEALLVVRAAGVAGVRQDLAEEVETITQESLSFPVQTDLTTKAMELNAHLDALLIKDVELLTNARPSQLLVPSLELYF